MYGRNILNNCLWYTRVKQYTLCLSQNIDSLVCV